MLLAAVGWLPIEHHVARSEEPTSALRLELTLSPQPRVAPQQAPDPKIANQDVEKAMVQIRARERSEELARETLRAPSRPPHLRYDVGSGIQSRNINDALRRR